MALTPSARRALARRVDERLRAEKQACADKIRRLQEAFSPPLGNAELSAGLGLRAPADGERGLNDVGRFLSSAHRLRHARPDRYVRALIDMVLDGELYVGVRRAEALGGRRELTFADASEAAWLSADWTVVNLAGRPLPERRNEDWEDAFGFDDWGASATGARPAPLEPRWLDGRPVGVLGLGTMRLSTEGRPDRDVALSLLIQALDGGIRFFDTADSYALNDDDIGHSEALIAEALREWGGDRDAVVVATKAGLTRPAGRWIPDTRPEHLERAVARSLRALGVEQIPLLQLHVPNDKKVPLEDSVGALAGLKERGWIRHIGLCNVSLEQLERARAVTEIASVQNPASARDGKAFGGLVQHCAQHGVLFIAHSPLGGHRKAALTGLEDLATERACTSRELELAWLASLGSNVLPIPGTTRSESLHSILRAAELRGPFDPIDARIAWASSARDGLRGLQPPREEVVVIMGPPAAGKTSRVEPYVERGYVRLNRDELGGTLDGLVPRMTAAIADGERRFVLDNTYGSVASRQKLLVAARDAGLPVRCVLLDTPMADCFRNASARMLDRHDRLLSPDEIKAAAKTEANTFPPAAVAAWFDRYQAPSLAEGFTHIERVPFRRRSSGQARALLLDYDGTLRLSTGPAPFPRSPDEVELLPGRAERLKRYQDEGWLLLGVSNQSGVANNSVTLDNAQAAFERTNALLGLDIEVHFCPHPAGAIKCWCRKPMPGIGELLIRRHGLDPSRCVMVGDRDSDRQFAENLGVPYRDAADFFDGDDPPR